MPTKRRPSGRREHSAGCLKREVVLVRDLRAALACLNPELPESAREQAIEKLTRIDFTRSLIQHNREFSGLSGAGSLSNGGNQAAKQNTRWPR